MSITEALKHVEKYKYFIGAGLVIVTILALRSGTVQTNSSVINITIPQERICVGEFIPLRKMEDPPIDIPSLKKSSVDTDTPTPMPDATLARR